MSTGKWNPTYSLVYYDAPNDTAEARRALRRFMRAIRKLDTGAPNDWKISKRGRGWSLLTRKPKATEAALLPLLPPDGELRIMGITDAQAAQCRVFWGALRTH